MTQALIEINNKLRWIDHEIKSLNKNYNLIMKDKWYEIPEYKHLKSKLVKI